MYIIRCLIFLSFFSSQYKLRSYIFAGSKGHDSAMIVFPMLNALTCCSKKQQYIRANLTYLCNPTTGQNHFIIDTSYEAAQELLLYSLGRQSAPSLNFPLPFSSGIRLYLLELHFRHQFSHSAEQSVAA